MLMNPCVDTFDEFARVTAWALEDERFGPSSA
jgi:hypothetical protein